VIGSVSANGIPAVALAAYRRAANEVDRADPACNLEWTLLAGIGRVESDHGQFAGAQLLSDGLSTIPVIGPPLNGSGTALIRDTDNGRLDGDRRFDHAVGPMQFIPSTWAIWASDGDQDGRTNPFDINDATLAAARYLCAAGGNLSVHAGQVRAVLAYNHSMAYVHLVLAYAAVYAGLDPGRIPPLPTGAPPPVGPTSTTSPHPHPPATTPTKTTPTKRPTQPRTTHPAPPSQTHGSPTRSPSTSPTHPTATPTTRPVTSTTAITTATSSPSSPGSTSPSAPVCPTPTGTQTRSPSATGSTTASGSATSSASTATASTSTASSTSGSPTRPRHGPTKAHTPTSVGPCDSSSATPTKPSTVSAGVTGITGITGLIALALAVLVGGTLVRRRRGSAARHQ
jgi:hypothetical protein